MGTERKIALGACLLILSMNLIVPLCYAMQTRTTAGIKLIAATRKKQHSQIKDLLANGANPNFRDKEGNTALHYAAQNGDVPAIELLITNGAKLEVRQKTSDFTPLLLAVVNNKANAVRVLLSHGANAKVGDMDGETVVSHAVAGGNPAIVKALLDKGADPNYTYPSNGDTLLMLAIDENKTKIMKLLLAKGANVHAKNDDGQTALSKAKAKKSQGIIKMLKKAGAKR